jgi:anti-sigma-K factor RskA
MNIADHEIFDDLCSMHAFGALDGEDVRLFEEHIRSGCRLCEDHLREYRNAMRALPYSNAAPTPSSRLRGRIESIARLREISRFRVTLAAAALLVAALGAYVMIHVSPVNVNDLLRRQAPIILEGHDHVHEKCAMSVHWIPNTRSVLVVSEHVCPAPEGKVWQLWCIVGGKPRPAGVFNSGPDGRLEARADLSESVGRVDGFAVTLEDQWQTQPTSEIYMQSR